MSGSDAPRLEDTEHVGVLRIAAARFVWLMHMGTTVWMLIGWALPWTAALWAVVIWNPLIHLQWWLLGDRCVLTVAEEKLRGPTYVQKAAVSEEGEDARCLAEFMSRVLGRPVPHWISDALSYGVCWTGFSLAALRLWMRSGA